MGTATKDKEQEISRVVTPPFRVSFPSVFQKSAYKDGEPKYSVTMIFEPDRFTEKDKIQYKKMRSLLNKACIAKFQKKLKDLPPNYKRGFRKGEEKPDTDGYGPGKIFAVASTKRQPGVINRQKEDILDEEELYGGCWARATVTAYAYDNIGKGVAFGLQNIQKLGEGEDFTSKTPADQDFDDDADEVWSDEGVAADELDDDDDLL